MATVTKNSYEFEDNEYLDAESVHVWSKDESLQDYVNEVESRVIYAQDVPSKNLLPIVAVTQTISDVTFTVNADGSISTSGTASANITYVVAKDIPATVGVAYKFSGASTGTSSAKLVLSDNVHGAYSINNTEGDSDWTPQNDFAFSGSGVYIQIANGQNANGYVFKPMIRLASITDDTYVPYSKTTVELSADLNNPVISATAGKTIGTAWTATGLSVTIPKAGVYALWAGLTYSSGAPRGIAICMDGGTYGYIYAKTEHSEDVLGKTMAFMTCSAVMNCSGGEVFTVMAKSAYQGTNQVSINAKRIA